MPKKGDRKMSEEELAEIASRYTVLTEFAKKESRIYKMIKRYGLFDKLCGQMKRKHVFRGEEELVTIASEYNDLMLFKKEQPQVYSVICQRGLYDKLCAHMKRGKKVRYTNEELASITSGYSSMKEFYTKNKGAFIAVCRRGLVEELCGHMERKGSLFKRKIYVFTFSDGYAYVGLAKDPSRRRWEHLSGRSRSSPILPHIKETGATFEFKVLTDWLDKDIAAKTEDDYIKKYAADGWKMLNRARGGGLGSLVQLYTERNIKKEISKYEYFEEFREGSPGFYRYIRIHHLQDKYLAGLKSRKTTNEERMVIIASCKTSGELYKKNKTVYKWLHKHHRLYEFYPKKKLYLSDEERIAIISSCKTSSELRKKSPREYKWLLRHHRLNEFFPKRH